MVGRDWNVTSVLFLFKSWVLVYILTMVIVYETKSTIIPDNLMARSKKKRHSKVVNAIIIIADIENSSQIAETTSPGTYNNMIREYHRIASRAIDEYSRTNRRLNEAVFYKKAIGDEVIILLNFRNRKEIVTFALNFAVLLEVEWSKSRFNGRRIREDKSPCRLRIGIGQGQVTIAESVWEQGDTPEGYAIAKTKRIEANAGADLSEPHILIAGSLKSIVQEIGGIETGASEIIHPIKTVGTKAFEAVRIKSYEGLYNEFKQRIRIRDRYSRWFTLGYQAYSAGDYNEAYRCFKLAVKYRPEGELTLTNLAGICLFLGKLDEAETTLRKVLSLRKDCHQALNTLGSVLVKQDRLDEAEKMFRKALKSNPEYSLSHYNLGNTLFELNRPEEAEDAYKKAIKLQPDYIQAYCNLAALRLNQERLDDALMLTKKALAINPHHEVTQKQVKYLETLKKGIDFVSQDKLDEAVEIFREMSENYHKYPLVFYHLGVILYRCGKLDEAENAFIKAIELNPSYRMALCSYARLKKEQGLIDDALDLADKALEINPKHENTIRLVKELKGS